MKRTADPYRDLDVIDSRAPRFNQATIGVLAALAVATGWWWLLGLLGAQLLVGLTLGRRFCLPCLAYFELVQPRFGEGPLEDARPPRFANLVGAVFLTAATVAYAAGLTTLGAVLGGIVAALALLAAATGFCTGCEAYKLGSFLLGRPFVSCPLPPATTTRRCTGDRMVGRPPRAQPEAGDLYVPALRASAACDERARCDRTGKRRGRAAARAHGVRARGSRNGTFKTYDDWRETAAPELARLRRYLRRG